MPKVMTREVTPEVSVSQALSLFARAGDGSVRTRVAVLVADGCDGEALVALADRLEEPVGAAAGGARKSRAKAGRR